MLMCGRGQHNIVEHLSPNSCILFNASQKKKKKKEELPELVQPASSAERKALRGLNCPLSRLACLTVDACVWVQERTRELSEPTEWCSGGIHKDPAHSEWAAAQSGPWYFAAVSVHIPSDVIY